jgi:hypothetical protein
MSHCHRCRGTTPLPAGGRTGGAIAALGPEALTSLLSPHACVKVAVWPGLEGLQSCASPCCSSQKSTLPFKISLDMVHGTRRWLGVCRITGWTHGTVGL